LKAKVGLEAVRGITTTNEIAQEFGVRLVQVNQSQNPVRRQTRPQPVSAQSSDRLYLEIARLKMELDWFKKSQGSACHDSAQLG
jgi:transposase